MPLPPVLLRAVLLALPAVLLSCAPPAYQERGLASYIADQYTGRRTSSGQIYHPQGLTAAHTSLPFGTELKVKNHYNGRTVTVLVNDRFPYYPGRVINLSRSAAEQIQIPYMRMADVTVTAKTLPGQQRSSGGGFGQNAPAPPPPPGYGAPAPGGYGAPPPAGYGTNSPPGGLPPPPPGYGTTPPDLR